MMSLPLDKLFNIRRGVVGISLFLHLCVTVNSVSAGAWSQKENNYYFKIAGNYLYTTNEFNHEGEQVGILEDFVVFENTAFQDFSVQLYLEYGLTNWLTVISDLSYKNLTTERTETGVAYFASREIKLTTSGFSDIWLSGRLQFLNHPLAISIQPGIKIPLGYDAEPDNNGATLGTGEVDGEAWLLLGRSMWPLPFYISGGFGYRSRGGPNHDEYLFNGEIGYSKSNFLVKFTVDGVKNTTTPPDIYGQTIMAPLPGGGGALPEILYGDQDYLKLLPGIIYKFDNNWGIQAELIHIAAGKNIISGTTYSVGIVKTR